MEQNDPVSEVSRRLCAARRSLGPDVVNAAAHACRVAIGKTVLRHAEGRVRHRTGSSINGLSDHLPGG